jgi:Zn-dependent M28 family amino/carboxypeptidase
VRFAFWGAEESGLLGSQHYVDSLTARERKNIALYLNFDMVGSPNFVRFVYDGDGSTFGVAGPTGSKHIEATFNDYFASQGLESEPTQFDGRSDYDAFITAGIPAGGLFTGAEGVKTAEQAVTYGGKAGEAYDPCYHAECDTYDNVSIKGLDQMSDAIAHATLLYAQTKSAVNGTGKGSAAASYRPQMQGNHMMK